MINIYNIIEVANTHAGSLDYVLSLIEEYSEVTEKNIGIKFQPLSADGLSHTDFEYYPLYQKLEFSESEWNLIISTASRHFDVWLDMFDEYSVKILQENIENIKGIKLQSSTLKNYQLRTALKSVSLENKLLMINVAGYDLDKTKSVIKELSKDLKPKEVILQLGFQDYPTAIEDCGLHKVNALKDIFNGEICFADHTDGQSEDAIMLPMLALAKGCTYIEKHIMHSKLKTEYDASSSVYINVYKKIINHQNNFIKMHESDFLVPKEKEYLRKTYQMPIAKKHLEPGESLDLNEDFVYKRTAQAGLTVIELETIIQSGAVLKNKIKQGMVLQKEDFNESC